MTGPPDITLRQAALLARAVPGRLFVGGSAAEPRGLLALLRADPDLWAGRVVTGAFIPGVNDADLTLCGSDLTVETIFTTFGLARAAGKVRHLPLSYANFWRRLAAPGFVGAAVITVPPPRSDGTIGLGLAADFAPAVIAGGARLIGLVNPAMPDVADGPRYPADRFAALARDDSPLAAYDSGVPDDVAQRIAGHLLTLLRPASVLQMGLGKVPVALCAALADSGLRDIAVHSGMIAPALLDAIAGGAIAPDITTGVALGDCAFHAALSGISGLRFRPVGWTHDHARLAALPGLVAVNTALQVDLAGQVNAEWRAGRQVSGQGGLVDFLRGARASPGGLAIIALPSTAGGTSRIVTHLPPGTPATVTRADTQIIVTEYGIADLSDATATERATRLTAIAHPRYRDSLANGWDALHNPPP